MTHSQHALTMLILNTDPKLEDDLVDYLMTCEGVGGFSSMQIYGHGEHANLSIAEQVTGRRRRAQFQIIVEEDGVAKILAGLAEAVGSDIVYWQQPVSNPGRVGL